MKKVTSEVWCPVSNSHCITVTGLITPCWVHVYYDQSELNLSYVLPTTGRGILSNVISKVVKFTSHLLSKRSEIIEEKYARVFTLVISLVRQTHMENISYLPLNDNYISLYT